MNSYSLSATDGSGLHTVTRYVCLDGGTRGLLNGVGLGWVELGWVGLRESRSGIASGKISPRY